MSQSVKLFQPLQWLKKLKAIIEGQVRCLHQTSDDHASAEAMLTAARKIFELNQDAPSNSINGVVFSMDRALQLQALLGSYRDLVKSPAELTVIYRASTEAHETSYLEVFEEFADLIKIKRQTARSDFKPLLIQSLSEYSSPHVFFLVDDNMFIEPTDLATLSSLASIYCIPSMRMGENLSHSYTMDCPQSPPKLESLSTKSPEIFDLWQWKCGELDWNYPLSVDGHIFQRKEIIALSMSIDFDSPNRFEEQLQQFREAFIWRFGACYQKSRLINIPYNKVQTDIDNLHGSVHQDDMLKMWAKGMRIDRRSYYGTTNRSAHQELPLRLLGTPLEEAH